MGATSITGGYLSGDAGADTITATILSGQLSTAVIRQELSLTETDGNDTISLTSAPRPSSMPTLALTRHSDHFIVCFYRRGGAGNDTISAAVTTTSSTVFGDKGADDLTVGTGGGQAVGVAVYGDGSDVSVTDGAGNDTITLSATSLLSRTTLFGGAGEDNLTIGNASGTGEVISSTLNGNKGNDTITVNGGTFLTSSVYGGAGNDSIALTSADSASIYGDLGKTPSPATSLAHLFTVITLVSLVQIVSFFPRLPSTSMAAAVTTPLMVVLLQPYALWRRRC